MDNPRINWRTSNYRYESAWSWLNKFAHLNVISRDQLTRYFCNLSLNQKTPRRRHGWSLNAPINLDLQKLADISIINADDIQYGIVDPYIKIFSKYYQYIDKLTVNHLRFCPECVTKGYHTQLFQCTYIQKCPIHHVNLSDTCPNCNRYISYELKENALKYPYGCDYCGYILWDHINDFKWSDFLSSKDISNIEAYLEWSKDIIKHEDDTSMITGWLPGEVLLFTTPKISPLYLLKLWSSLYPGKDIDISDFDQNLNDLIFIKTDYNVYQKIALQLEVFYKINNTYYDYRSNHIYDFDKLFQEAYDDVVKIAKSIRRRVKKLIQKKHSHCLFACEHYHIPGNSDKESNNPENCYWAMTYERWLNRCNLFTEQWRRQTLNYINENYKLDNIFPYIRKPNLELENVQREFLNRCYYIFEINKRICAYSILSSLVTTYNSFSDKDSNPELKYNTVGLVFNHDEVSPLRPVFFIDKNFTENVRMYCVIPSTSLKSFEKSCYTNLHGKSVRKRWRRDFIRYLRSLEGNPPYRH